MRRRRAALLICLITLTGCGSEPPAPKPPPKTPLEIGLETEMNGDAGDTGEGHLQIRQAAANLIKANQPEAEVEGIAIRKQRYDYNFYVAWVAVSDRGKRQTEVLAVRLFVKDSGETYWKAEPYEAYLKTAPNRIPCEKPTDGEIE